MFRPVPALLTLVAAGACLPALEISDNDTKFAPTLWIQTVAAKSTASTPAGDPYSAGEGFAGRSDDVDFYLRRFRAGFKGTHKGFAYQVTMAADNAGRTVAAGPTTPTVHLWDGFVGKTFKMGSISHTITAGKQNTWMNTVVSRAIGQLMLGSRATASLMSSNGIGAGYRLVAPGVSLGLDVQNNTGDTAAAPGGAHAASEGEGLYYTARLELTGPDVDTWGIGRWQESFAGAAGKGVALGLEAGMNKQTRAGNTFVDTKVAGIDLLLHIDGLTALAEARHQGRYTDLTTGTDGSVGSTIKIVQAGYAFAIEGLGVLEPALRYQDIDKDTANDKEGESFGALDWGNSGTQYDLGLNLYLAGHQNKLSLMLTSWKGEVNSAGQEAEAKIARLQHQLVF